MKRIKKLTAFLLVFILAVPSVKTVFAKEAGIMASMYIVSYQAYTSTDSNGVNISYSMLAVCDELEVDIEFQKKLNNTWRTAKTWSKSSTSSPFVGEVTYTGSVGAEYRVLVIFKALINDTIVETRSLSL